MRFLYTILFLVSALSAFAQDMIVVGQVRDEGDKEPIAGAVVHFENSQIATVTNDEGFFMLQSSTPQKQLFISILGYKSRQLKLKAGQHIGLDILLEEDLKQLEEFVLLSPNTTLLMERVRARRNENNYAKFTDYQSFVTSESKASLNQLSRKFINRRLFGGLRKYIIEAEKDTTQLLPIYMNSETYLLKDEEKIPLSFEQKSILPEHSKSIGELVAQFPSELNFYNPYILLFGKNFLSPLANSSDSHYRFLMTDSLQTAQGKEYTIRFRPKNDKKLFFKGEMVIDSATCAVKRISAMILPTANLNFIQDFSIEQTFRLENARWVLHNQQIMVEAQLKNRTDKQTNSFLITRHLLIENAEGKELPQAQSGETVVFSENFSTALDSIQQSKTSKFLDQVSNIVLNDYLNLGYVDWGPLLLTSGTNKAEGERLTLSGRTSKKVFENFTVGSAVSYGFGDKTWKFGGEMQYRFPKEKYAIIGAKFEDNYYQTDYDFHDDLNFENSVSNGIADITSYFFREFTDKFNRRQTGKVFYNRQWHNDFNTQSILSGTRYLPNNYVSYQSGDTQYRSITDYRLAISFRYSHKQAYLDNFFRRIYINNYKPIVHFAVTAGRYSMENISGYYLKLHLAEKQSVMIGGIGKLNYSLQAGYIFGRVPFPLLEIYSGIDNYGLNELNYYVSATKQYASDMYANLESQFITNGFIFNNIPLIKKLNLREIISLKIATGHLSEKQRTLTDLPHYMLPLSEPYLWLGGGICNLFRFMAIEYIMEMPRISQPKSVMWNLRCRVFIDF